MAFLTASGPRILLGIQMEKKMAERPPSFMRGMSMLPSLWRVARSNLGSRRRWVVSSWVSMTMEVDWSFLGWSETDWAAAVTGMTKSSRRETSGVDAERCMGLLGI